MCCPQYLDDKFKYIKHSLKSLKYQKIFILNARKKALNIHTSSKLKKNTPTIPITHRTISLPTNIHNKPLYDKLTKLRIPIIQTTSQTITNFTYVFKYTNNITTFHASIYSILCNDCDKYYTGEAQCNLDKRIYEHE